MIAYWVLQFALTFAAILSVILWCVSRAER